MDLIWQSSSSGSVGAVIAVFLTLLTVVTIGGLIVALCRAQGGELKHKKLLFAGMFVLGGALRIVFSMCVRGYRDDYALFTDMFKHLRTSEVPAYYGGSPENVLYPAVYLIYLVFGGLSNAMSLSPSGLGAQFMIKLPLIIAELLTAFVIYKIGKRFFNVQAGTALCGFVCLCPMFFVGSSLWTSPAVFMTLFALAGAYCLAAKKFVPMMLFFAAAFLSCKEGIYVFPAVCVISVYHLVRAILNFRKKRAEASGENVLADDTRALVTVPVGFVAAFLASYLVCLIAAADFSVNPFVHIYEFLLKPLADWSYFTYNGLSVYALFGRNGSVPSARFPTWLFVCIFIVIITAVVCVVYFSKRNRATMVMLAAYSLFTMQVYYPGSTAIGFVTVFGMLLASYALVRDKRLLYVLFLSGLCYVVNSSTALSCAGYLNNLDEFNLAAGDLLLRGGLGAVPIVCSALVVVSHLYFTVVAISVGMTGQKALLGRADDLKGALNEFFARKKVK